MAQLIFRFNSEDIIHNYQQNETISSILQSFCHKVGIKRDNFAFLCNGTILNEQSSIQSLTPNLNNQIIILVTDIQTLNPSEPVMRKSNYIICPQCKESIILSVKDYKVSLYQCKNGHRIDNILLSKFYETQNEDISKILCDKCKCSKARAFENKMFICVKCKYNLCIMCAQTHDRTHNLINYDQKNYICEEHGEFFHSYCYSCDKNLCTSCENIHRQHATESFGSMIKDKNILFEENEKLRKYIEELNKIIFDIINKLNKVRENLGIYYEIHKNIISNNNKLRNYEVLFNINEFNNNTIKKDLENIIKDNNMSNQFNNLMNMYQKMETDQIKSETKDKIFLYDPEEEPESSFNLLNNPEFNNQNSPRQNQNDNSDKNNNLSKSDNKVLVKNEKKNEEELEKKRSATIEIVSELKNILLEEIINKTPLISELLDINELLKKYKEDSPEINIVKLITSKYKKFREVRQNGNSFYTCFLYRLFEFISLNRDKTLYDKTYKKILDAKILIMKNGYDWDFLKESYNLFKVEFNSCFEQSLISVRTCRQYIDELFKSDERYKYLNHFIHFCIAAYIKDNKILYENYITDDFEKWLSKVEEVGLECSQLEILACVNYFDIGVKIEYLYPTKLDVVKYPENKKGDEIFINILFRPDHYDVLYK